MLEAMCNTVLVTYGHMKSYHSSMFHIIRAYVWINVWVSSMVIRDNAIEVRSVVDQDWPICKTAITRWLKNFNRISMDLNGTGMNLATSSTPNLLESVIPGANACRGPAPAYLITNGLGMWYHQSGPNVSDTRHDGFRFAALQCRFVTIK